MPYHTLEVYQKAYRAALEWLEFAKDLGYIEADAYQGFDERYREIGRMLRGVLKRYDAK